MDTLKIRLLPVEKGDCILLRFPDHSWAVVDCDKGSAAGVAAEIIGREEPRGHPVRFVLATHPHIDHVGGLRGLFRALTRADERIGAFYHCGARFRLRRGATPRSYAYVDIAERLQGDGRIGAVSPLKAADTILLEPPIPGMEIAVLNPDAGLLKDGNLRSNSERNNASVVLRISFGDVCVLLTGDIERAAWGQVVTRDQFEDLQVLKVPHHGAESSMPPAPLLSPAESRRWALISCRTNQSDKPHPNVLQSLWDASWTTRCTGWSPHCREKHKTDNDKEYYPIPADGDRCTETLRLALEMSTNSEDLEIEYGKHAACCVDNELVIAANGTMTHSRPPGAKTCDR